MNALKQYIDLFDSNRQLIEDNSCAILNAKRDQALSYLRRAILPRMGSENYEISDLNTLLLPDYGLNLARVNIDVNPAASFRCDVPNMSTALMLMVNDTFAYSKGAKESIPEGVTACSLRTAAIEYPQLLEKYYANCADIENPLVALNTLLAQDGVFIHVNKDVKCSRPLQLVNILHNMLPLMAIRRILIVMEENAEASMLLCDHTQMPDTEYLNLQTIEIFANRNSSIELCDLEESSEKTTRLSCLYLQQEEGSKVVLDTITLYNGTTRNEFHTIFKGKDASLRLLGMGIEDRQRHLDTYSYINHAVGSCHTDELFKYVLDDEAKGAFTGRIYVAEGAEKTEAYQSNRNLVGSDKARMFAKPQLEIYNDDVKCSHGTAIGQLDAMQIFYMRSRGLSEKSARHLLKQAFMADVIDGVGMPQLRDRLRMLVEARFSGRTSACTTCGNSKCATEPAK